MSTPNKKRNSVNIKKLINKINTKKIKDAVNLICGKKINKKLLTWKNPVVKGSSQGLKIGDKLYKTPEDLKEGSLEFCDESKRLPKQLCKEFMDKYENAVSDTEKDLKEAGASNDLLKEYNKEHETLKYELQYELTTLGKTAGIDILKTVLQKYWKDYDDRKEPATVSTASLSSSKKGRTRSYAFFEKACKNPNKIKDIEKISNNKKMDCAVVQSINVLTTYAKGFSKSGDDMKAHLTEALTKLEKSKNKYLLKIEGEKNKSSDKSSKNKNFDKPSENKNHNKFSKNKNSINKNTSDSRKALVSELNEKYINRKNNFQKKY